jgi:hypothetical protein
MKLSRTRSYKVNLGNYESAEYSNTISVEGIDLFTEEELTDMDPRDVHDALREFAEARLKENLEPELRAAAEVSQAQSSILITDEPPARRERSTRRSTR